MTPSGMIPTTNDGTVSKPQSALATRKRPRLKPTPITKRTTDCPEKIQTDGLPSRALSFGRSDNAIPGSLLVYRTGVRLNIRAKSARGVDRGHDCPGQSRYCRDRERRLYASNGSLVESLKHCPKQGC